MKLICGVEEAGRGPVIGPMVMCGLTIDEKKEPMLKKIGAKDSKLLSPKQREFLYKKILTIVKKSEVVILRAWQVDAALQDPKLNLNWLEALTSAKIIAKLKPDKAILDCPSNNIKAYTAYVKKELEKLKIKKKIELISEHKADLNHPIVSAASIIAKVTRDREIEKIKKIIKQDFGSGYPSDPTTQEFLKKNYKKFKKYFRTTWSTYQEIKNSKTQKKLGEF